MAYHSPASFVWGGVMRQGMMIARQRMEGRFVKTFFTFLQNLPLVPCMWNGVQRPCFLFARKFDPSTIDALLNLPKEVLGYWQTLECLSLSEVSLSDGTRRLCLWWHVVPQMETKMTLLRFKSDYFLEEWWWPKLPKMVPWFDFSVASIHKRMEIYNISI